MISNIKYALAAATAILGATSAAAFPIATTNAGESIIATSTDDVVATYLGNSASYDDQLFLKRYGFIFDNHATPVGSIVDLGSFAVGTELEFELHVLTTGDIFYSGPASRNPDDHAHATVNPDYMPGQTLVSFEDLNGGPYDYNDLSFSFTNVTAGPAPAVPEPATWAMMIAGASVIGMAMRRRTRLEARYA